MFCHNLVGTHSGRKIIPVEVPDGSEHPRNPPAIVQKICVEFYLFWREI